MPALPRLTKARKKQFLESFSECAHVTDRPVADRKRMSPERQARFLEALRTTWSVTDAARAAGVRRQIPYRWRKRDKAFAEAWDKTVERGTDAPGDEAARRDPEEHLDPAFHQGAACAALLETDNRLLMCLLKAHRPARFKGRHGHETEQNRGEQRNQGTPDAIDTQERCQKGQSRVALNQG